MTQNFRRDPTPGGVADRPARQGRGHPGLPTSADRTSVTPDVAPRVTAVPDASAARSRWAAGALAAAAGWSLVYLVLGIAWLAGAGGNPADPEVDDDGLSLLSLWDPRTGAAILTALGALGVLLVVLFAVLRRSPRPPRVLLRLAVASAAGLGVVLAVVLPDYRLIAAIAYSPILLVMAVVGRLPGDVTLWTWPVVNMAVLSLAGLAWFVVAAGYLRQAAPGSPSAAWTTPEGAARWGRWATGVAVAVPLGYAATRFAWALGIPVGVDEQFLTDLGTGRFAGAALATLAVLGAILTLGLVQRWGEVFPPWLPGLRGRRVPVGLAVVPAAVVSVVVASAGLMFVRLGATGEFDDNLPFASGDVAAWLPEMFWPLWGAALAAAGVAYLLRRRGEVRTDGPSRRSSRSRHRNGRTVPTC
jgi:hypothetical protein